MKIVLILVWLLSPASLLACCEGDNDTLADEVADRPTAFDIISGKVERWNAHYFAITMQPKNSLESTLAETLLALNDGDIERATETFSKYPENSEDEIWRGMKRKVELAALFSGTRQPDWSVFDQAVFPEQSQVWACLRRWMDSEATEKSMIPDLLGLKLAGNKTSGSANDQLRRMNLLDTDEWLLELIAISPLFECFDIFYSLSMYYAVDGRQSLAHYARLRAWQYLGTYKSCKVRGFELLKRPKMLTAPFNLQNGAVKPISSLAVIQKDGIAKTLLEQQQWAKDWQVQYDAAIQECRKLGKWDAAIIASVGKGLSRPKASSVPVPDKPDSKTGTPIKTETPAKTNDSPVERAEPSTDKPDEVDDDGDNAKYLLIAAALLVVGGFWLFSRKRGRDD
ncbi:MAG: hypothetical protein ACYTDT_14070 [Planctomycetota bacterium]|jgi:hypothetical protein